MQGVRSSNLLSSTTFHKSREHRVNQKPLAPIWEYGPLAVILGAIFYFHPPLPITIAVGIVYISIMTYVRKRVNDRAAVASDDSFHV